MSGKFHDRASGETDLVSPRSSASAIDTAFEHSAGFMKLLLARRPMSGDLMQKAIHRTLLDIAGGMDYLHSVGVLHGDLKVLTPLWTRSGTLCRQCVELKKSRALGITDRVSEHTT